MYLINIRLLLTVFISVFFLFNCSKYENNSFNPNKHDISKDQIVPESRHLITRGKINLTSNLKNNISFTYKELNPKMDLDSKTQKVPQFLNDTLPILARNLLSDYPDMIFLDAEVAPAALNLLLSIQIADTDGREYTLGSLYNFANDQSHGACLVKKSLFDISDFHSEDEFPVGRDVEKGNAGYILEVISKFSITVKATQEHIDIWLGKGPHYKSYISDNKFFNDGTDSITHKPTGLFRALNKDHTSGNPVLLIGDWNNELNSTLMSDLKSKLSTNNPDNYNNYETIINNFSNLYLSLVDSNKHPGSNCNIEMNEIFGHGNSGKSIDLEQLEHQGIVNTQVFYWENDSGYSANITNYEGSNSGGPEILYSGSLGIYGQNKTQVPISPIH